MGILYIWMLCLLTGFVLSVKEALQENQPPKVQLLKPDKNSGIRLPATIQYAIEVRDTEDGFSGYQEIPAYEAFLEVQWISDKSKLPLLQAEQKKQQVIYPLIAANGCLNCHAFTQKLAGPSFQQVAEKYAKLPGAVSMLATKIRNGSKGVWGDSQQMPAHPDIKESDAKTLVQWIFKKAADKQFQYLPGLEGTVSLSQTAKPSIGVYVFTAIYTDHGVNGTNLKTGSSSILLPVVK